MSATGGKQGRFFKESIDRISIVVRGTEVMTVGVCFGHKVLLAKVNIHRN